ncbi:ECF transporter S component [Microbacterium oxydans]|uniref:ECF transporter S component n=1 Tax=Microbacterium oxydans TaxID=82380 RepID=UPI0005EC0E5A|nr:ECF transporter S component [Microbacterium oxydans]
MPAPRSSRRLSTRVLLTCAALAVVHVLLHLSTLPLLTALAAVAPPAYALVAGVHSLMPFLARRITGTPGAAIVTSGIAALLVSATSSSGLIAAIPVLLAGCLIDLMLWRTGPSGAAEVRYLAAGAVTAVVLFAVSLAVFSPAHRTPVIIIGTLLGRLVGEAIAVVLSRLLAGALVRAGVSVGRRAGDHNRPAS